MIVHDIKASHLTTLSISWYPSDLIWSKRVLRTVYLIHIGLLFQGDII